MSDSEKSLADLVAEKTCGCRLEIHRIRTEVSVDDHHAKSIAELFDAAGSAIGARKMLLPKKHPLLKPLFAAVGGARALWTERTIAYEIPGIRLIHVDKVTAMRSAIDDVQHEIEGLEAELAAVWPEVIDAAQQSLGELFDRADFPETPVGSFAVAVSFPSIAPDRRLSQIDPQLFAAETNRVKATLADAARRAEAEAAIHAQRLVGMLVERLQPSEGRKRVIRDATVEGMRSFAANWRELSLGTNGALDSAILDLLKLCEGTSGDSLRSSDAERQRVESELRELSDRIDRIVVDAPIRRITLEDQK